MYVSKPISALTNYNKVLSAVDDGNEVVLTKNGESKSMIRFLTDMRDVDDEMRTGGRRYTKNELKDALGIRGNAVLRLYHRPVYRSI
jgi:hypothetical protein